MGFWDLLLVPLALLKTLVEFFAPACRLINRSDHFAPHPTAGFEGYYSRTRLEDGGCLVIIFCWVKTGKRRANLVFVSYTPPQSSDLPSFQYEFYPDKFDIETSDYTPNRFLSFVVHAPGLGTFDVSPEKIEYTISVPDVQLSLNLCLTNRTAWRNSEALSGPMGPLLHLSHLVPLNWHVHAPTSDAVLTLTHAEHGMQGHGITHVEKNWGTSFPRGWLWGQAFGAEGTTLAFAGGAALPGVHLYLLGYRSRAYAWDFRPPFAAAIGPFSPFLRVAHDSREGKAHLEVRTFTRKLVVKIEAPPESFTPFPAPLEDGHRPGFAYESFKGRTWVELWSRRWPWQEWACVEQGFCRMSADEEPCSALEFGGFFCHRVEEEKKKRDVLLREYNSLSEHHIACTIIIHGYTGVRGLPDVFLSQTLPMDDSLVWPCTFHAEVYLPKCVNHAFSEFSVQRYLHWSDTNTRDGAGLVLGRVIWPVPSSPGPIWLAPKDTPRLLTVGSRECFRKIPDTPYISMHRTLPLSPLTLSWRTTKGGDHPPPYSL